MKAKGFYFVILVLILTILTIGCSQDYMDNYTQEDLVSSYRLGYEDGYAAGSKGSPSSTPEPSISPPVDTQPATPAPTFSTITIRGSGYKKSEPFKVTTKEWKITWSYETESPEYASFSIYIYPRGETIGYIENIFSGSASSGSSYSYAGPGEYYADVLAANLISWEIQIKPA